MSFYEFLVLVYYRYYYSHFETEPHLGVRTYHTACIGKWHLGMDWTLKEGVERSEQDQETVDYSQPIVTGPNEVGFDYFFGTAGCTTDDPPLCFIENQTKRKVPFFVYLPLSVPHIPWLAHEDFEGKSCAGPRGDQVLMADKIVGEINKKLSELKIADSTLVIFTSDNGPYQGVNGHESAGK